MDKIGFILCCGFYYIKYTENNSLIIDLIKNNSIEKDDQVLFNNYFFDNKRDIITHNENDIIYKTIILNDNRRIGIISDNIISRMYKKELYCFHPCLKSKDIISKIKELYEKICPIFHNVDS